MLEKFEMPPLGMELSRTARKTIQTRTSLKASQTWSRLRWAFCVPLWLSFVRSSTATFSASVKRFALTGESGRYSMTKTPATMVAAPMAR